MMKNILWLSLLLLFAGCSKDSDDGQPEQIGFELIYSGKVLAPDDKVEVTAVSADNGYNEMLFPLLVKNSGDKSIRVTVEKKVPEAVAGSENDFCWGGKCWPATVTSTPEAVTIEAGKTDDSFHASYRPKTSGTLKIEYIFTDENDVSRSVVVSFKYNE